MCRCARLRHRVLVVPVESRFPQPSHQPPVLISSLPRGRSHKDLPRSVGSRINKVVEEIKGCVDNLSSFWMPSAAFLGLGNVLRNGCIVNA